jgi:hypothetical protein
VFLQTLGWGKQFWVHFGWKAASGYYFIGGQVQIMAKRKGTGRARSKLFESRESMFSMQSIDLGSAVFGIKFLSENTQRGLAFVLFGLGQLKPQLTVICTALENVGFWVGYNFLHMVKNCL